MTAPRDPEGDWPVVLAVILVAAAAVLFVAIVLDVLGWVTARGGS